MTTIETASAPPPLSHILETCVYVRDVKASSKFYQRALNIEPFAESVGHGLPLPFQCQRPYFRGTHWLSNPYALFLHGWHGWQKPRTVAFSLGTTTLLLFQLGRTASDQEDSGGVIPGHGPSPSVLSQLLSTQDRSDSGDIPQLKQHFCLAVSDPAYVAKWDAHLQAQGVHITGRMNWERGGKSVYFEDPDGHVGEIGSRGIWAHYDLELWYCLCEWKFWLSNKLLTHSMMISSATEWKRPLYGIRTINVHFSPKKPLCRNFILLKITHLVFH